MASFVKVMRAHRNRNFQLKTFKRKFGKISVEVLSSGGRGTSKSVVISLQPKKKGYEEQVKLRRSLVFNVGQDFLRRWKYTLGFKVRDLKQVSNILITQNSWHNLIGIGALCNGVKDFAAHAVGYPSSTPVRLKIYSPPGIEEFMDHAMYPKYVESGALKILRDGPIDDPLFDIKTVVLKEENQKQKNNKKGTSEEKGNYVFSYIFQLKEDVPDFYITEEERKGVEFGMPWYGIKREHLKDDGTQKRGPIIVLDCPSEKYLHSVLTSHRFKKYHTKTDRTNDEAALVVHMVPLRILQSDIYKEFIQKFGPNTRHLLLHEKAPTFVHQELYDRQEILGVLNKNIYLPLSPPCKEYWTEDLSEQIVHARPMLQFLYSPLVQFSDKNMVDIDYIFTEEERGIFESKAKKINEKIKDSNISSYPDVVCLGTGSASNYTKSQSSILMHIDEDTSMMLDCGDGTFTQLLALYKDDELVEELAKIKFIFISHRHEDHYCSLPIIVEKILEARQALNIPHEPLFIMIEAYIYEFCHPRFADWISDKENVIFIDAVNYGEYPDFQKYLKKNFNLTMKPVPVHHITNSLGLVIMGESWKIVYSGDTRPCKALIYEGRDCDLLIHEATYPDEYFNAAKYHLHCTQGEAVHVGALMRAKYILLTHHSFRKKGTPSFSPLLSSNHIYAVDFMKPSCNELLSKLQQVALGYCVADIWWETSTIWFPNENSSILHLMETKSGYMITFWEEDPYCFGDGYVQGQSHCD